MRLKSDPELVSTRSQWRMTINLWRMGSKYPYQHERWDLLDSRSKQSQIRQQDGAQPSKLPPGTYDCGSQNSYTSSGTASSAETLVDCFKTDLGILQFSGESFLSSGFSQFPRQFESFASSEHNGLIMEAQYFTTHHEAYGQDQFIHASDPYQLPNTEFKLDPRMDYGERLSAVSDVQESASCLVSPPFEKSRKQVQGSIMPWQMENHEMQNQLSEVYPHGQKRVRSNYSSTDTSTSDEFTDAHSTVVLDCSTTYSSFSVRRRVTPKYENCLNTFVLASGAPSTTKARKKLDTDGKQKLKDARAVGSCHQCRFRKRAVSWSLRAWRQG